MNNDTGEVIASLRKELKLTRILTVISIVVTLILFGVVFWMQRTVKTSVEPLAEQLSEIDTETLNGIMTNLEVVTEEIAEADIDWEKLSETVNSLDVDAVNEVIQGMDTEALSEMLVNLNEAIETLQQLGNNMGSSLQGWLFGGNGEGD
ncbi:MAG: hypothetical protein LUH58_02795 [Lachnospiraceae bacterium]|nr:hypothetical protein [Lachnospiraceae bacterium]